MSHAKTSLLNLFLIRHADAEHASSAPDALRGLTALGRQRLKKSAELLAKQPERIELIYTSPLVRAVQTAEIIAHFIGLEDQIVANEVIAQPRTLDELSTLISDAPANLRGLAFVGHEPTLSDYAAHILGLSAFPRSFKKGMIVALTFDRERRRATFKWAIAAGHPTPSLVL